MLICDVIQKLIELESIYGNVPVYHKDWEQDQATEVDSIEMGIDYLIPCDNKKKPFHGDGLIIF